MAVRSARLAQGCSSNGTVSVDGGITGGDSSTGGGDGATGGGDGSTGGGDGGQGGKDTGTADVVAPPTPANVIVGHTAPGLPPFRLCLATGTGASLSVTQVPALPESPRRRSGIPRDGLVPGGGRGNARYLPRHGWRVPDRD